MEPPEPPESPSAPSPPSTAGSALGSRNFRLFLVGHVAANMGVQMQDVALGWELYQRTGSALALGNVGLAQILPVMLFLWIPAGHLADRFDRRRIVQISLLAIALCSLGLAAVSWFKGPVSLTYAILFVSGIARAFQQPARSALVPLLVPREHFPSAVTWSVSAFQLATVLGPALGGFVLWMTGRPLDVYVIDAGLSLMFAFQLARVRPSPQARGEGGMTLESFVAGIRYVRRSPVIFGSLSLDLFAVLFGGATALLPIFADDILAVGPQGLGYLRAAPSIGALATSFLIARRGPMERAGRALLLSVVGFAVATIVFGISRNVVLSFAMLFLTGAFDMVSVVIRHTLVQVLTPDSMRGRVSAINGLFIGLSNELGAFESGVVAHWLTPTLSVVVGGVGSLVVVAVVAVAFPSLRKYGKLGETPGH